MLESNIPNKTYTYIDLFCKLFSIGKVEKYKFLKLFSCYWNIEMSM